MYHRIAEPGIDPWGLAVSPENFAQHLAILQKHTQLLSLRELAGALKSGQCPDNAVAITFDDGYADNLYRAKPLLDHYQAPATVFVTTGNTKTQRLFWWDQLEAICFQPRELPDTLSLKIKGKDEYWQLGEAVPLPRAAPPKKSTHTWEEQAGRRMHFYNSAWQKLLYLTDEERNNTLDELAAWSGYQVVAEPDCRPMTPSELIDLDSSRWIEIGAHTVNHLALTAHSAAQQAVEIVESKTFLEELLNHPVPTFSYPFGINNRKTVSLVKEAGFTCACTTEEERASRWSDRFRLPRLGVFNWDGNTFEQRIAPGL